MKRQTPAQPDPLLARLREEASAFAPELPAGLHGRVASAIADAPAPAPARSWRMGWWLGATLAAAAIALAAFLSRDRTPVHPVVQAPQSTQFAGKTSLSPSSLPLEANPIALAEQWVEKPLQNEVHTLMNHLTSAGDTLTGALPATPKRARPNAL